ncbi:MAG: URC4/urg3 family protein [Cyanobacteria bacterium P01_D01_bin.105]
MTLAEKSGQQTEAQAAIAYLQTPQAIRDRANQLFELCQANQLEHFAYNPDKLEDVAAYVVETTRQSYPDFDVPFHSRWRHFDVGGTPRLANFYQALRAKIEEQIPPQKRADNRACAIALAMARSQIDLVIISVLLDAGAGSQWRYQDIQVGKQQTLQRSEGLAVASLRAFEQGIFSSVSNLPYQVDATALEQLTLTDLASAFQVTKENPLVGLSGRLALLQQLGKALTRHSHSPLARPSDLLDAWIAPQDVEQQEPITKPVTKRIDISADHLLGEVLRRFGSIWPGRVSIEGVNLGDVWPHPALASTSSSTAPGSHLMPFHKLSQWLTYSLVEPLAAADIHVNNLNALTGLAEYRNGGLCVDMGLLVPKHSAVTRQAHVPSSPMVVEWRALTIVMLDLMGDRVRQRLDKSPEELPLIKVLEGGTWAAGRRIAKHHRATGAPPITIESDGTVF